MGSMAWASFSLCNASGVIGAIKVGYFVDKSERKFLIPVGVTLVNPKRWNHKPDQLPYLFTKFLS
jgi:hypothetical protein